MSRQKSSQTAADAAAAIEQVKQKHAEELRQLEERQRLLTLQEDQLRGELVRQLLARRDPSPRHETLRVALAELVEPRYARLFDPARF